MKRWTLRILLCLVLGAITTVGVSWVLAFLNDSIDSSEAVQGSVWIRSSSWAVVSHSGGGTQLIGSCVEWRGDSHLIEPYIRGPDPRSEHPAWAKSVLLEDQRLLERSLPVGFVQITVMEASGWPDLAMRTVAIRNPVSIAQYKRFGPVIPIWPGFVIDTLFYAAIWCAVFFGFVGGKRFIRSKRGRCPRCGYDLRGAPGLAAGCPECGWGRAGDDGVMK